jgi:hypothetical protein
VRPGAKDQLLLAARANVRAVVARAPFANWQPIVPTPPRN